MAKIAVIKTGGKQYKVKEGQAIRVEKLDGETGAKLKFDTLLLADSETGDMTLGHPSLGEKVEASVVEQGKGDKIQVVKFHSKVRYKRTNGHRQTYTKVMIDKIA